MFFFLNWDLSEWLRLVFDTTVQTLRHSNTELSSEWTLLTRPQEEEEEVVGEEEEIADEAIRVTNRIKSRSNQPVSAAVALSLRLLLVFCYVCVWRKGRRGVEQERDKQRSKFPPLYTPAFPFSSLISFQMQFAFKCKKMPIMSSHARTHQRTNGRTNAPRRTLTKGDKTAHSTLKQQQGKERRRRRFPSPCVGGWWCARENSSVRCNTSATRDWGSCGGGGGGRGCPKIEVRRGWGWAQPGWNGQSRSTAGLSTLPPPSSRRVDSSFLQNEWQWTGWVVEDLFFPFGPVQFFSTAKLRLRAEGRSCWMRTHAPLSSTMVKKR